MPIRAKQPERSRAEAFGSAASAAKSKAKPFIILGAIAYGVTSGIFNLTGSWSNDAAVKGTLDRSVAAYLEKAGSNVAKVTLSVRDITGASTDGNKIYLDDAAFKEANKAYEDYKTATGGWLDKAEPLVTLVGTEGNSGLTFTYNNFSFTNKGAGSKLMAVADRYNLVVLPSESAMAWPEMTIEQKTPGTYTTAIRIANSWSVDDNAEAVRGFLRTIEKQEKLIENISGTYKVRREEGTSALIVYQPGATVPAAETVTELAKPKL
jgi:hypothetical protein